MLGTLTVIFKNALERGGPGPEGEKYLHLKSSNTALRGKVLEVPGGILMLTAAGFMKKTEEGVTVYQVRAD